MSNKKSITTLSIAAGTAFVASLAMANVANAAEGANPFAMNELSGGYMQLADGSMDKAKKEGKCGGSMNSKSNMKEGKCGAGMKEGKSKKEGKCGENKAMKEGKCGEGKAKEEGKAKKEGKCGEGKCGGNS